MSDFSTNEVSQGAQQEHAQRAKWFGRLAGPSLIYAMVYTVCTYHNDYGVGALIWVLATLAYVGYLFRASDVVLKKGSRFYLFIMGMLGVSTVFTTNLSIVFFNYAGFCLLLVYFLLVQTRDVDGWSIWDAIFGILCAFAGTLTQLAAPVAEGYSWLQKEKRGDDAQRERRRLVAIGIAISIPALLILGSLLMSADAVFGSMLGRLCFDWSLPSQTFGVAFTFVFGLFAAYCGMHYMLGESGGRAVKEKHMQPALVAQIFTSAILVLYVWFCFVQIVYLFGGFGTLPEGMTYAGYARSGFFQLLAVCVLNLILVLSVRRFFESSAFLNRVLLAICLCSYIMTASSAYRMLLYIQAYRLTVLRIVVLVALAAIAVLLAGVCRSIFSANFRILPYSVAVICVMYTLFSLAHVEGFIARYNLAHLTEDNAAETFSYLGTLSLDAMPATLRCLESADGDGRAAQMKSALKENQAFYHLQDADDYISLLDSCDGTGDWMIYWLIGYRDVLTSRGPHTWNVSVCLAKHAVEGFFHP